MLAHDDRSFLLFHLLLCPPCLEQGLVPSGYSVPINWMKNGWGGELRGNPERRVGGWLEMGVLRISPTGLGAIRKGRGKKVKVKSVQEKRMHRRLQPPGSPLTSARWPCSSHRVLPDQVWWCYRDPESGSVLCVLTCVVSFEPRFNPGRLVWLSPFFIQGNDLTEMKFCPPVT